jgi:hypothetical protein
MDEGQTVASEPTAPKIEVNYWNDRPVYYHEISYGQMRRIRKIAEDNREDSLLEILMLSAHYEDGKKVFKNRDEIDSVPAKKSMMLVAMGAEAFRINTPESLDPSP